METEKDSLIKIKRLSQDNNYYNYVFKKTEKIVSVIFYILSETNKDDKTDTHVELIKDKAIKTHELSLKTLSFQHHELHTGLETFQYQLVALESTLKIAQVAKVIPLDIMTLLVDQLDTVMRYINNHYLQNEGVKVSDLVSTTDQKPASQAPRSSSPSASKPRAKRVNIPEGDISTDAYLVYSQMTDRGERIKTVLEAKPQATIKDIAEVITDVSEKTIQRELNSLIEKGQVIREGERRWSRYSVAK
jgi:DNA-binding transcriptional ArsR family regulator